MNASRLVTLLLSTVIFFFLGCSGRDDEDAAKAYRQFREAVEKEDIAAMKQLLPADQARELDAPDAKMKLALIKAMSPREVKITNTKVEGTNVTLTLEGQLQDQTINGTALMAKASEHWQVVHENWKIDLTTFQPEQPTTVTSLIKDPTKPPKPQVVLTDNQAAARQNSGSVGVSELAFARDGRLLISASYDDFSLKVWDAVTGTKKSGVTLENRPTCMRLTPDDSTIVLGDAYGAVTLLALDDDQLGQSKTLIPPEGAGQKGIHATLAISPDGKRAAVSGHERPISIWSLPEGTRVTELIGNPAPQKLAFSPSGKVLATAKANALTLWNVKDWNSKTYTLAKVDKAASVGGIHFGRDSRLLALCLLDASVVVFDVEKRKEVHNFATQVGNWDVKFSPDGTFFAVAQENK